MSHHAATLLNQRTEADHLFQNLILKGKKVRKVADWKAIKQQTFDKDVGKVVMKEAMCLKCSDRPGNHTQGCQYAPV